MGEMAEKGRAEEWKSGREDKNMGDRKMNLKPET